MNPSQKKLFCFGYGYVAQALEKKLSPMGWVVEGTTRTASQPAAPLNGNHRAPLHIYNTFEKPSPDILQSFTHFLISIPPECAGDLVLRDYSDFFKNAPKGHIEWVGYFSSTSVYGNHNGHWVTEESCLKPSFDQAHHRAQAERQWLCLAEEFNFPIYVFRLSGIYGPGRSALDRVRAGCVPIVTKEEIFFSRCHVDDICQAVEATFFHRPPEPYYNTQEIFNIADDYPCSSAQVLAYAYLLLNRPCPAPIEFEKANLSQRTQQFYQGSKKVSNEKLKKTLGINLLHRTYKEGLQACLAAQIKDED